MRRIGHIVGCIVVGGLSAAANAELINLDFSAPTGAASPAPASSYGAAAGQAGFWNNITAISASNLPLRDLAGNLTSVTLTMTPGGFMFDASTFGPNGTSTATGSNEEFLMDDVWDAPPGQITIGNLAAGNYALYVYGGSPDSATTQMNFIVNSDSQFVGGLWENPFNGPEDYKLGITHALFNVNHAGGSLVINVPDVPGFESVNGLQIAAVPEPASIGLIAATGLATLRRRRSR